MKINKLCSATAVCVVLPCVMEPSCLRCPPSHRLKPLTLRHACVVFPSRIERQRHRKLFMECIRRDAHNAQRVRGASSPNQCLNPSRPRLGSGGAHDSMCPHSTCRNRTLPGRLGLGHSDLWGSSLAMCLPQRSAQLCTFHQCYWRIQARTCP